ncbi:hypothetical protein DPMN_163950 [Dreissena polymorpha]|uniref:Uncharacterized protein n=1 Tax=Dreissena polymorpha TaxID=45954 RepID=A0A9D4ITA3_DREPO|nr:hypothetical protein DPMN_163950 [Dreissena polymorpha]
MSPIALIIVFGPNCLCQASGSWRLKTKASLTRFIVDYNALFKKDDEDTPNVCWERQRNNKVPDRHPPQKLSIINPEVSMEDYKTGRNVVKWPICHGTVSTVWYLSH